MAKTEKTIPVEITKKAKAPIFRNRTKIDQLVYDQSYTAITISSGKTVSGEWYKRYAGKNGPLVLVIGDEEREKKDDKDQEPISGESKK